MDEQEYSIQQEEKMRQRGMKRRMKVKLNPQNEIMVKQINGLSDKKPREKIKGKEEKRQEQRRPVLDKEEKIDFYPQWKQQQELREEKEERE